MAVNKFDNSMFDSDAIGTSANKLLQLDGSTKIPAVDGSLLTGIPSSFTKSASDPAIATNPSGGVGTIWVNTTSGETYCCTDATAGANVWKNVGAGSDNIVPYFAGGAQYGYVGGGYQDGGGSVKINNVQKYSYTSDGNSVDICDLTESVGLCSGNSSQTHGYRHGGFTSARVNTIDKFPFASQTNATDVGNLTATANHITHSVNKSNWDYGYRQGGHWPATNIIDKYSLTSDGDATDVGDLAVATGGIPAGAWSTTHGYTAGGYSPPYINNIQKHSFVADGNAVDVADMTNLGGYGGGASSTTHGYHKRNNAAPGGIQKWAFASDSNATNVGDGVHNRSGNAVTSSQSHGYDAGGYNTSTNVANSIEKWSFTTDGNSTDVGDIAIASGEGSAACEY